MKTLKGEWYIIHLPFLRFQKFLYYHILLPLHIKSDAIAISQQVLQQILSRMILNWQ